MGQEREGELELMIVEHATFAAGCFVSGPQKARTIRADG